MESPRYTVVVVSAAGVRDVRASNVTLETAQATQSSLLPLFPNARVVIEPLPPSKIGTERPGISDTWHA